MEKMLIRRLQKTFSLIANKFEDGLKMRKAFLRCDSRSKEKHYAKEKYPQKDAVSLGLSIQQFHAKLLRERKWGNYELRAALVTWIKPFVIIMDDNKTFDSLGAG